MRKALSFTAVRNGDLAKVGRFVISTALSASITFGLPILLHYAFDVREHIAVAIAFVIAYAVNFFMISRYVFKSENSLGGNVARYMIGNALFRAAEYGMFVVLLDFANAPYILALFLVLAISSILKFFGYGRLFSSRS